MFNTGAVPIVDYSAGVWGTKAFPCSEQVQLKAARYFLGVHRFAATAAILGDMGWSYTATRHKLLILKLWNRLCDLPRHRITRKIFDWDKKFGN